MSFLFVVDTPNRRHAPYKQRPREVARAIQKHLNDRNKQGRPSKKTVILRRPLPTGWWRREDDEDADSPRSDGSETSRFFEFTAEGPGSRQIVQTLLFGTEPSRAVINAFGGVAIDLNNDSYKVLQYSISAFLPFLSFSYRKGFTSEAAEFWDDDGRATYQRGLNDEMCASALITVSSDSMMANFGENFSTRKIRDHFWTKAERLMNRGDAAPIDLIFTLCCLASCYSWMPDYQRAWQCVYTARRLARQFGGINKLNIALRSVYLHLECLCAVGSGNSVAEHEFLDGAKGDERAHLRSMHSVVQNALKTRADIFPATICELSRTSQYMRAAWELLWPPNHASVRQAQKCFNDIPIDNDPLHLATKLWLGHYYMFVAPEPSLIGKAEIEIQPSAVKLRQILRVEKSVAMLWIVAMGQLSSGKFTEEFEWLVKEFDIGNWSDFRFLCQEYLWLEEYEGVKGGPLSQLIQSKA